MSQHNDSSCSLFQIFDVGQTDGQYYIAMEHVHGEDLRGIVRQMSALVEPLDPFIDDMTQQVSRSLQFYLASGSGREQPEKILICGGCANIPGVADVIASRVGIPAERGDPLGQMKISSRAKGQNIRKDATALLTACGLALRSFD